MYFKVPYKPPPPRNREQAEDRLLDALWEHWYGRTKEGKDILLDIAIYVQERTLDGSYEKAPEQVEKDTKGSTNVYAR